MGGAEPRHAHQTRPWRLSRGQPARCGCIAAWLQPVLEGSQPGSTLSPFPCLAPDFDSWEALQSRDYSLENISDRGNPILKEKKIPTVAYMGNVCV